jgi:hypothetical protein
MGLFSGTISVRVKTDSIAGRTIQSGGSIGGVKKPGTVYFGTTWSRGNQGNYLSRATKNTPTLEFSMFNTTRRPVQGTNYQVYRSKTLG